MLRDQKSSEQAGVCNSCWRLVRTVSSVAGVSSGRITGEAMPSLVLLFGKLCEFRAASSGLLGNRGRCHRGEAILDAPNQALELSRGWEIVPPLNVGQSQTGP